MPENTTNHDPRPRDLSLYQQIYVQGLVCNTLVAFVGSESKLQELIEKVMPFGMSLTPKWTPQWGPTVWKSRSEDLFTGPDHVWLATTAEDMEFPGGEKFNCCLVSISGSVVFSAYDWFTEDLNVQNVNDFDAWVAKWLPDGSTDPPVLSEKINVTNAKPFCSEGTGIGAHKIITVKAPDRRPGGGTTLLQFLQKYVARTPGNKKIILAGHSLGGILASTIALGLRKANIWGTSEPPDIMSLSCAAPSPVNGAFVEAFKTTLPAPQVQGQNGYDTPNTNWYNVHDVAPRAWSTDENEPLHLDYIFDNLFIPFPLRHCNINSILWLGVKAGVEYEKQQASQAGTDYVPLPSVPFTGAEFDFIHNPKELARVVVLQHTLEYAKNAGVEPELRDLYTKFYEILDPSSINSWIHIVGEELGRKDYRATLRDFPALRHVVVPPSPPPPPNAIPIFQRSYPYDTLLWPQDSES